MFVIKHVVQVAPSRGRDRFIALYIDRGACGAPSKSTARPFTSVGLASAYARRLQSERIIGSRWSVVPLAD